LPVPQPLPLLIRFTVGSLPLFSFLQHTISRSQNRTGTPGLASGAAAAAAAAEPAQGAPLSWRQARAGGMCMACEQREQAPHFWLGKLRGLGADTLPSETMRRCLQLDIIQCNRISVSQAVGGPGAVTAQRFLIGLTWLELPTWCNLACPHAAPLSDWSFSRPEVLQQAGHREKGASCEERRRASIAA
jgi:hypothetical protein